MFAFGIKDIIDIVLVALMLYYIYRLMKESRSLNVFIGIMLFIVMWLFVSQILEMKLLGSIMDKLVSVGVLALIVLFQEEIRKFLYNLGANRRMRSLMKLFSSSGHRKENAEKETIMPIVMACMSMGKRKVGALIVIERSAPLDDIVDTGDVIDAAINQRLIENIFFKNSPLHDRGRLHPAREPQRGHTQGTGTAPPGGHGHLAGERRYCHHRLGGNRTNLGGHHRRIQAQAVGRAAGKHPDAGNDKLKKDNSAN